MPKPSPRAVAESKIYHYLKKHTGKFNAPFGVLKSLKPFGQGKMRTITFGMARYLDATINIYREDDMEILGKGALIVKYGGRFKSANEVIEQLSK